MKPPLKDERGEEICLEKQTQGARPKGQQKLCENENCVLVKVDSNFNENNSRAFTHDIRCECDQYLGQARLDLKEVNQKGTKVVKPVRECALRIFSFILERGQD